MNSWAKQFFARSFWRSAFICGLVSMPMTPRVAGATPGTKLWEFETGGEIRSSPAIASDGTIYFGSRDKKVYAIMPTGKLKWTFQTGAAVDAAPAIGPDGTIYAGSYDGILYAISPEGQQRWQVITGNAISEPAAVASDGSVYFVSQDRNLYAVAANGARKWQFATGGQFPAPSIGRNGTIYVGNADGNLYALNPDSSTKWKYRVRGQAGENQVVGSSCVVDEEDVVYFLSAIPNSRDAGTGGPGIDLLYALRADGTKKFALSQTKMSWVPVLGIGNTLYGIGAPFGEVVAVSPVGAVKSTAAILGPPDPQTGASFSIVPTTSSAVAGDGTIYLGASARNSVWLIATDQSAGIKWRFEAGEPIRTPPTIGTNGVVYVGSDDHKLYAVAGSVGSGAAPWPMYRGNAQHTGAAPPPVSNTLSLGVSVYAGVEVSGVVGRTYRIESQDTLSTAWSPVATVTLDRTPYLFFDLGSPNATKRFYRAILLPQ